MVKSPCSLAQKAQIVVVPESVDHRPAPIDGALIIEVAGPSLVEQDPATPLMANLVPNGNVGDVVLFTIKADADPGSEVEFISETVELTIVAEKAAFLNTSLVLVPRG